MRVVVVVVVVVGAALASVMACGRSAEPGYVCPQRPGDACEELAAYRVDVQGDYDAELAKGKDADGNLLADIGACMRSVVQAQLDGVEPARCGLDRCAELCALHPCAVDGAIDRAACRDRCVDVSAAIDDTALSDAVVRAAEQPGLCTCTVCDEASAALCTELFTCAAQ